MGGLLKACVQSTARRETKGWVNILFLGIAVVLVAVVFYNAGPSFLGTMSAGISRGVFLMIIYSLVFIKYRAGYRSSESNAIPWYDWVLILATCGSFLYWIVDFNQIVGRAGDPSTQHIIFGSIVLFLSIEVTRRALGGLLAGFGLLILLYGFFGDRFPIELFTHQALAWTSVVTYAFSLSGIMGWILDIIMMYVVMFVLFGALMQAFGASALLIDLPYAIAGRVRGGPGITAVVASTFMGMISGSATANVATTGSFTIPLMKRTGYPPHVAGAIEPAASTGGMFMPPVMGAGAFIMANMTNTPYITIALISLAPALIYFASVAAACYTEAGRLGIKPLPASELPRVWPIIKRSWYYLVPIALLVFLLVQGYTPPRAAYWAILCIIALSIFARLVTKKKTTSYASIGKEVGKNVVTGLKDGADDSLTVAALTGTIGIIVAVVFLTGVGFMFTSSIMELTHGWLPLGIVMALIVSYVLGMGMTVTTVYVLLAVLFAPALAVMGMSLLAAHLLLFWFSQSSNISPPVAIAAYVGAGIAGADPTKTGFTAFRYSFFLFLLPLMFIYSPILMPNGFNVEVGWVMISALVSTIPWAAALSGFLIRKCTLWERAVLLASAIALFLPNSYISATGLIVVVAVIVYQVRTRPLAMPAKAAA